MDKKIILQLLNDYAAYYNCHFILENSSDLKIYTSDIEFTGNFMSFNIENEIYTLTSSEHISDYEFILTVKIY